MIKIPSYFTGFNSKVDGSASIRFSTQELSPEDFGELKRNLGMFGWLVFAESAAEPPTEAPIREGKTPSQRLRDRMFVYYKKSKISTPFEVWREKQLDIIGEGYLSKLD